MSDSTSDRIIQAAVDFISRLVTTFLAVFVAGLLLLFITRVYIGWEVSRFQAQMREAFQQPLR